MGMMAVLYRVIGLELGWGQGADSRKEQSKGWAWSLGSGMGTWPAESSSWWW